MIDIIIPILIIGISLIGVHKQTDNEALSLVQGKCIKGLAAIFIVIIHIPLFFLGKTSYQLISVGGYLLVGIFFFYSGYGITKKSIINNENIKQQLPKRIIKLFKIIIITELIYIICNVILFKKSYPFKDILLYITGVKLINGAMWYIIALIIIYILIILLSKIKVIKGQYTKIAVLACVFYVIICFLRGRHWRETQSCVAFIIGTYMAEDEHNYEKITKKKSTRQITSVIAFICFLFSNIAIYGIRHFYDDYWLIRFIFGWISTCSFIILLIECLCKVRLENKVLKFLGNISTEIYLSHLLILEFFKFYFPELYTFNNSIIVSILVLFTTIAISTIVKKLSLYISI